MSRFRPHSRLMAAACLAFMFLAGCRSRTEFFGTRLPDPPTRVVSDQSETDGTSSAAEAVETDDGQTPAGRDESRADRPAETPDPASITEVSVATPSSILEESGAVVEYDKHGRTVGVDLTNARVFADVIRAVAELTELQWLDMRGARITDDDLAIIGSLPRLHLLALSDTLVTDAGLVHLTHQQDLRFLSLDRTAVTDAGLMTLSGLPRLEGISLSGTSVSRAGATDFEAATPGCKVILDADAPLQSPAKRPAAPAEPYHGEPTSQSDTWWVPNPADDQLGDRPRAFPHVEPSMPVSRHSAQTSETLNAVLQRKLLDPDVLGALGRHLIAQEEYGKAARALETLVMLQPENHQARFDLGIALARNGQFEAAQVHLAQVVGDPTTYYNLGVIAYELNHPERSEWYFSRAVDAAPDFDEARQWLDHVRQATAITPATHTPQQVDTRDLIDLLMSELGSGGTQPSGNASGTGSNASGAGIDIVPTKRSKSPEPASSRW